MFEDISYTFIEDLMQKSWAHDLEKQIKCGRGHVISVLISQGQSEMLKCFCKKE